MANVGNPLDKGFNWEDMDKMHTSMVNAKSFEDAVNALSAKEESFRVNLALFNSLKTTYSPAVLINEIIKEVNKSLCKTGSNSEVNMSIEKSNISQEDICTFRIRTLQPPEEKDAFAAEAKVVAELPTIRMMFLD